MFVEGSRRSVLLVLAILIACFAGPFVSGASAATVQVPSRLNLNVRETTGIARSGEVVRSGVPLPRSLNVLATGSLAIVDAAGTPVPAEFEVTARWNAGKSDAAAPIQWLLVTFPATVGANQTATYRLVTDGSATNPAPATRVNLTQSGNEVTVDTGAATFRLGANPGALFDEVVLANGTRLISGSALSVQTGGSSYGHSTTRRVWIEHQGPLTAIVVVQGAYDTPAIGGGQVSTRRRYVFTAGSPTAIVRHVTNWEGNLACAECVSTPAGTPNGVRIDKVRDDLTINVGSTPTVTAVGNFSAPVVSHMVATDQSAWVRQQLRPARTSPQVFDVNVAGAAASGVKADGALLAASGPSGTVAIALNHMHRYEPQALRLLAGGHLAIDAVDDKAWLANHQGLFATLAVTATPGAASRDDLNRTTWAPLNRPLRAWPDAQWFASTDALDDFPVGQLPADLAGYDTAVTNALSRTVTKIDQLGINGLMTFGVYPRYWGKEGDEGEIGCGSSDGSDPTPNEHWDDLFWCGSWTDYHNTVSTAQIWAMRTGAVEWLDEIAFPGALRTLHTQIMQCSPTESWFYCGQSPTGYGAYRTDFNSSHAYFENLFLYYWLTGDQTVIDIVQRGADSFRRWECPTRGPNPVLTPHGPDGPACAADYPVNAPDATLTGRVGQQWQNVFRFMGLASNDASFLEDFRLNFARSITQQYVAPVRNGVTYGFWGGPDLMTATTTGNNAPHLTDSQWTIGMYDMHYLNRYQKDSGDAPLGNPAMRPSQVISSIAHTYKDIEPVVLGNGSVAGLWARLLQYNFTGPRLGGALNTVVESDRELYDPEKTGAAEVLIRAGQQEGDASLVAYGRALTVYMIGSATAEQAPLGKLMGQDLTRLHPAVALLANGGNNPLPPPPAPTAPAAPGALTAQAASTSAINLSWQDNSSDETSFRIEKLVSGTYQEVQVLAAGSTQAQITGLTAATSYSFRVRAANAAGNSGYSNIASATTQSATPPPPPPPATPAAPTSLAAQAASTSAINLSWQDNSTNETSFRVEQLVGGGYQEVQVLTAGSTHVQIIGLAPGTAYTFRVRAANTAGYSGYSNLASAVTTAAPPPSNLPAAPSSLSGWAASPGEAVLAWIDNASNETAFRIERQVNGSFQEVMTVGANVTSARVAGLAAGSTHFFRVRASNAAGASAYSNTATVITPDPYPTVPGAPAGLSAKGISASVIQLTWSDGSTNETSFRIEKKVGSTYQEILVVGANVTSAQISGLAAGSTYSFRVRAANAVGTSGYSNVASATTATGPAPTPGLAAPQITSATGLGGGMVQVNWRDNSSTEIQFVVEKLVNGVYQPAAAVGANSITARVTGLTRGTLYTFRVKAVDVFGHAAYSNGMNVTAR